MALASDSNTSLDEILAGGLGEWFKGRSITDAAIVMCDEEALFPDVITGIHFADRQLFDCPVYMRVPLPHELARARVSALSWMATEAKRDPRSFSWADAVGIFGDERVEEIEHIEVLARGLRKRAKPEQQYMTPENLQKCHPAPALYCAFNRLSLWRRMSDLRVSDAAPLDDELFWRAVAAVAKAGHLGPLMVVDPGALDKFIQAIASQLQSFREAELAAKTAHEEVGAT